MSVVKPEPVKLDPDVDVSLESLEKVDFSQKPKALVELDEKMKAAQAERDTIAADPLGDLFILSYKPNGPNAFVFFRSRKPSPQIVRDCQLWCNSRGYRYINFNRALVNLEARNAEVEGNPADISQKITMHSNLFNAAAQRELEHGPVRG